MGLCLLVCAGLLLAGCATAPGANPRDPWEPMNRGVFEFNETFDEVAFKPVAVAYKAVTPRLVRAGVTNFFNSLGDAWSLFNNVLQGKPRAAVETYFRITVNTFWGMGGVFDIASEIGVEPRTEDFGQTLGRWGIPTGPYLVLPVFGPSTVRDALAFGVETRADVVRNLGDVPTRNALLVVRTLEARANLLRVGDVVEEAALDKYSFTRDVFLQRRRSSVYDGEPPEEAQPEGR